MGQIRGSQLALEHMRRDKGGRGGVIVNTVSMAGQNVPLFRDHYHIIITSLSAPTFIIIVFLVVSSSLDQY